MKTILFLEWLSFGNDYFINAVKSFGYEVFAIPFEVEGEDPYHSKKLDVAVRTGIENSRPEFVFSFNFWPVVSEVCNRMGVVYISFTYDSPFVHLFARQALYPTNRIFVFDSSDVRALRDLGVNNAFYLPVGCAADWYDRLIPTPKQTKRYACDVAFIGKTYAEDEYGLYTGFGGLPEYESGYLEGLIRAQMQIYGAYVLEDCLTERFLKAMEEVFPYHPREDSLVGERKVQADYLLARKVTAAERLQILGSLSESVDLKVYTPESMDYLPQDCIMGWIDYYNDAPLAIKSAKINLNITLKSIRSGIPLRVMDILGCGGFLISNYQEDMMEYFADGEDFVMYESPQQVKELAEYYLCHEEQRSRIAHNGYQKAQQELSWEKQVGKMLSYLP